MRLEHIRRLRHGVSDLLCILAIIYQFLFEIEELSLEAWVREDHATLRFHETHCLEQALVLLLHQIGDHTGG